MIKDSNCVFILTDLAVQTEINLCITKYGHKKGCFCSICIILVTNRIMTQLILINWIEP